MFFTNLRTMITVVSAAIAMIFMLFFNAILSPHLKAEYDIDGDKAGYIMSLGALFYALCSPLVGIVFKGVPRRYIF
jgi:predicted MFS family arabinose efflux permease